MANNIIIDTKFSINPYFCLSHAILEATTLRLAKWVSDGKDFVNVSLDNIIYNCGLSMKCGPIKEKSMVCWCLIFGVLKFNVERAAKA